MSVFLSLLLILRSCAQSRLVLQSEVLVFPYQLQVLQRSRPRRLRLAAAHRWLWFWLSRVWNEWRGALVIVKPRDRDRLAPARLSCMLALGQEAARRCQEQPIDCRHRGTGRLSTEDAEFVLQHDDFQLLEVV